MNSTIFLRFLRALRRQKLEQNMENGLIFHVTIQIQILTVFSVQSQYCYGVFPFYSRGPFLAAMFLLVLVFGS